MLASAMAGWAGLLVASLRVGLFAGLGCSVLRPSGLVAVSRLSLARRPGGGYVARATVERWLGRKPRVLARSPGPCRSRG